MKLSLNLLYKYVKLFFRLYSYSICKVSGDHAEIKNMSFFMISILNHNYHSEVNLLIYLKTPTETVVGYG